METSVILLTCFIALVGLKMCDVDNGTVEDFADKPGVFSWCRSPILKMLYGIMQLIGCVFVLGLMLYLTFTEHWWYIFVYIGGLIVAMFLSFILRILLIPIVKMFSYDMFRELQVRRFVGTILIVIGVLSLLVNL